MGKQKTGKGVAALTEVLGGLKMDPKNVRRRERAAELRVARGAAAKAMTMDMRDDSIPDYPEGVAKLGARQVRATERRMMADEPTNEPGRAPHISVGYEKIPQQTVRMTFTGKLTEEGQRAVKAALDAPAPVRLSVTTLASAFAEACAKVKEADAALAVALGARMRAKAALDGEISRLANEVG